MSDIKTSLPLLIRTLSDDIHELLAGSQPLSIAVHLLVSSEVSLNSSDQARTPEFPSGGSCIQPELITKEESLLARPQIMLVEVSFVLVISLHASPSYCSKCIVF